MIHFSYNGINYQVDDRAYDVNRIQLPDGTVLEAGGWLETCPPQPDNLTPIDIPKAKEVQ